METSNSQSSRQEGGSLRNAPAGPRRPPRAAKVMVFVRPNGLDRARCELDSLADQGWVIGGELKSVQADLSLRLTRGH